MSAQIKIEKGVPLPTPHGTGLSEALRGLKNIGDSFVIPIGVRPSVSGLAARLGIKTATRKISLTEVRVWRIAS